jgi:hypothetical protein
MESPAAALQDEDGWDEFAKEIEDAMATAKAEMAGGSTMTDDECDQFSVSILVGGRDDYCSSITRHWLHAEAVCPRSSSVP